MENATQTKGKIAKVGSVISALLASSCCIGPVVLASLGLSGAGFASGLEKYRSAFMVVAIAFLGAAFYFTYRKKGDACCTQEGQEKEEESRSTVSRWVTTVINPERLNKIALWLITVIVLGLFAFPYLNGLLSSISDGPKLALSGDLERVFLRIEGMTCESCNATVRSTLLKVDGVVGATASFKDGIAIVGFKKGTVNVPEAKLIAAVAKRGYKASMLPVSVATLNIEGMTCAGCGPHIKGVLEGIHGVTEMEVNFAEGSAVVAFESDKVAPSQLIEAIQKAGYTASFDSPRKAKQSEEKMNEHDLGYTTTSKRKETGMVNSDAGSSEKRR